MNQGNSRLLFGLLLGAFLLGLAIVALLPEYRHASIRRSNHRYFPQVRAGEDTASAKRVRDEEEAPSSGEEPAVDARLEQEP